MAREITDNFIPAKIHIKEQPQTFQRFKAVWTPTIVILDSTGAERYRIEGFLPARDFLAQLEVGLGRVALESEDFDQAEKRFRDVCDRFPEAAGAAPEACYWAGVAAYKRTNKPEPLRETARTLSARYPGSEWTRKASVWAG